MDRAPRRRRRSTAARDAVADCVVGYLRVSTAEQADSGAGIAAQRGAIEQYALAREWTVSFWCEDAGTSGAVAPTKRPALTEALRLLATCEAGVLLVAKPDRLARRAGDLLALCDQAEREGWGLAAADGSVDLTTPHGRFLQTVLAGAAELERDLARSRTREALAAKRSAGVRLGRSSTLPLEVRSRIVAHRDSGLSWPKLAAALNADRVPTGQGGQAWYASTARAAYLSAMYDGIDASQA